MPKTHPAEFANVVIRFGDKVMIDYAQEIVIPAIMDTDFVRTYGTTRYFFRDQDLVEVQQNDTRLGVLVGRFVVDKTLKSEQEIDRSDASKKTLVRKHSTLRTAPSAVFAFILNTHRMVFLHETSYPPTLKNFETTLQSALRKHHGRYLDSLIEEEFPDTPKGDRARRKYANELNEAIPRPDVEVRPLSSISDVENYIAKFKSLHSITVALGKTNQDIDSDPFLRTFRSTHDGIGPKSKAKVQFTDKENGLNKDNSIKLAAEATQLGISNVTVRGEDANGDIITGTNDDLKAKAQIELSDEREDTGTLGRQLVNKYQKMEKDEILKAADVDTRANANVIDILASRANKK